MCGVERDACDRFSWAGLNWVQHSTASNTCTLNSCLHGILIVWTKGCTFDAYYLFSEWLFWSPRLQLKMKLVYIFTHANSPSTNVLLLLKIVFVFYGHLFYCCCEVAQSCLSHCDPMDYSLPGSSVHGTLQTRILEWVAILFSRGSSWPRD